MDHTEVAQFLTANPHFFEEHAELLGTIKLSSPLLGRAVSLQERQMEIMREKYRQLELRLAELLHLAEENDRTSTKYHRWTNSLLSAPKNTELPGLLITNLQEFFSLPYASLRLWNVADEYKDSWFAGTTSEDIHLFASGLQTPFCGENNDFEAATWIDAPPTLPVASLAMMPLRTPCSKNDVIGLMVLGSPEKSRYTSTMATHFLSQIADTTGAALAYLLAK